MAILGSINFDKKVYSADETDALLGGKQDLLHFDSAPTDGSENPVTSSGIRAALDAILAQLVSVFHFKGSVPYFDDLPPAADNEVGDVWNVEEDDMNYAWVEDSNDGHWDQLGPSLQDYLTKELAAETYLSKEDAQRLYLAIADAAATYLTKTDAATTYLTKTDAASTYLTKTDASCTYATQTTVNTHIADKTNPHEVTGQQVGVLDSSGKIAANLVVESSITDGAVSTAKIGLKQVTGARIADNTLLNSNFSDNSIAGGRIQANTVTGAQNNQDTSQASGKLAYNTVGTVNLRDGAVTAAKIDQTVLGNLATKSDAMLTECEFTAWEFADGLLAGAQENLPNIGTPSHLEIRDESGGAVGWLVRDDGTRARDFCSVSISSDGKTATMTSGIPWSTEIVPVGSALATRNAVKNYRLGPEYGPNADKPLAPAGDYALKSEIPDVPVRAVKRNGTALVPDAQGAVNVEVPVTSVNGKTGAVMLDGSIIPIADAATTTVLEAFQQVLSTANSKYTKPSGGIPASDLASAVQTALTDARTPTAHALTHGSDGVDPLDGSMLVVGGTGTHASSGISTAIEDIETAIGNINTSLSDKVELSDLATVAVTGDYNDLTNKPTIPPAQIQSDWNQTDSSAKDFIKNKPTIPTSFYRIVSHDGNTSVVANDGGTATLEVAGATIGDDDPLSDLADYLGLGDNATLDDVRQALGLSVDATLEDAVQAVPTSSEKTIATLDDLEPKLDADRRNIVPYAESLNLTLDPETAVYRLYPTGTAIAIPTPVTTALPATDGYYQFEIELAVPSTATSLTAPSGWTWLTGFELPMSGYAGRTVYVSCRMDLRGNAVTASCWRVA